MGSGPAVASLTGLGCAPSRSWGWDSGTEGTGGSHHPVLTAILFQLIFLAGILHVKVFFFFFSFRFFFFFPLPICFHLAIKGAQRHVLGPAAKNLAARPGSRPIPTEAASSLPKFSGHHHHGAGSVVLARGEPSTIPGDDPALSLNLHPSQAAPCCWGGLGTGTTARASPCPRLQGKCRLGRQRNILGGGRTENPALPANPS